MKPGSRRSDPITYLQKTPPWWLQHRPSCPHDGCDGFLVTEPGQYGDLWMCVNGCGARFFVEFD